MLTSDRTVSPKKLCLLGVTRNTENYGVLVLLSAAVEALAQAFPGSEIFTLDYQTSAAKWNEELPTGPKQVSLINLRFSWKLHLPNNVFRLTAFVLFSRLLPKAQRERLWDKNPWLRDVARADMHFSIAGGDSFSDIYGLTRFWYVILPQILVILMDRPLVQLPQTYGPFRTPLARSVSRFVLRRSCAVFSRDEAGVGTLRSLLGESSPTVHVVPDLGLAMSPQPLPVTLQASIDQLRKSGRLAGVNISSLLHMGGYSGANMFGLREPFPALMDHVIAELVEELGAHVLLIAHVCGGPGSVEDETSLCRKLLPGFQHRFPGRVHFFDQPLNHRETKGLIGQCDFFTGARMHACVAAVSRGVPAVCLAYSGKFAGVMAPLGAAARVVDLRTASIDEVLTATGQVFNGRETLRNDLITRIRQLPSFAKRLPSLLP